MNKPHQRRLLVNRLIVVVCFIWTSCTLVHSGRSDDDESFREFPTQEVLTPAELFRTLTGLNIELPESVVNGNAPRPESLPNQPLVPPSSPEGLNNPVPPEVAPSNPAVEHPAVRNPGSLPATDPGGRNPTLPAIPPGRSPSLIPGPLSASGPNDETNEELLRQLREQLEHSLPGNRNPPLQPGGPSASPSIENPRAPFEEPVVPRTSSPRLQPPTIVPPTPPVASPAPSADTRRAAPRNGDFRSRFNRILFEAAQQSIGNGPRGDSSDVSSLDAFVSRVLKSAQRSIDDNGSNWRRNLRAAWNNVRGRINESDEQFADMRNGAGGSDSGLSRAAGGKVFLWAVFAVSLLGLALILWRKRLAHSLIKYSERLAARVRLALKPLVSRGDLVVAFDQVLAWNMGAKSNWWNSRAARDSLTASYPDLEPHIQHLVLQYEVARYAPEAQSISRSNLRRCTETLRRLVVAYNAKQEAKSRDRDADTP